MAGAGNANMEQFETYFQRADLDRDGRISGAEAVNFLQGSNLPKQVLAQIWAHADQNHTGYLSRPEFYNALKLVTVAQTKRELTPAFVQAALYGPASAKIPAPQINFAAIPSSQPRPPTAGAPSPQIAAPGLPSVQNLGFRGQAPSNTGANQQFGSAPSTMGMNQQYGMVSSTSIVKQQFNQIQPSSTGINRQLGQIPQSSTAPTWQVGQVQPSSVGVNPQFGQAPPVTTMNQQFVSSQGNQSVRPPISTSTVTASRPSLGAGSPNIPGGGTSVGPGLPNSNTDWFGGNSNAMSGGVMAQALPKKDIPSVTPASSNPLDQFPTMSPAVAKEPKIVGASGPSSTSESMFGGDIFSARSTSQQVSSAQQQQVSVQTTSATISPTSGAQPSNKPDPFQALQSTLMKPSVAVQASQPPPPKPNQQPTTQVTSLSSSAVPAGVGSSASEQSQLPWPKMARASIQKYAKVFVEVDTDRDGKITGDQARNLFLSWRLPREVLKQVWDLSDQDGDSMLSLREFCIALYLMERYREGRPLPPSLPNSVMLDETLLSLAGPPINYGSMVGGPSTGLRPQGLAGAQPMVPSGLRPPVPSFAQTDGSKQSNQQNARGPLADNFHPHKISNGEDISMNGKSLDATEINEKVENSENMLLDSKEKLEFYRTKMQELVLYRSRCDNRLNEITERARADKGEAELLEKKYQEKYKQVAEIHSKLTIEEASFREIQERKMELQQAITKIEQGGSADGILQVRADRIQSDLEELLKALNDRCKKHNIEIKSAAVIELPPGWAPGIPEVAAIWDEDWDKFEDEGFSFDVAVPANTKSALEQKEAPSFYPDSPSNADSTSEKPFSTVASGFDSESVYSADESKSLQGSPRRQTAHDSPSEKYSDKDVAKSFDGESEAQRRSFDEPSWGNFDTNDDMDSVWGFSAKDTDHSKSGENYFFGSNDFGASPRGTDSPQADSSFKNSPFRFEDSVPGSPLSKTGNSPPRYSVESRDPFFDSFSRYDSFSTQDRGSSPRRDNLSRFDSISSTSGFDRSRKFSFDDSDPFGSSGPFKVSNAESPKKGSEWSSF